MLELEAEVARLHQEIDRIQVKARSEVAAAHRQYRRELVPLSQSLVPYVAVGSRRRGR